MFTSRYDSTIKQKGILVEFNTVRVKSFRTSENSDKEALTKVIDRITTLTPVALYSDRKEGMQGRF